MKVLELTNRGVIRLSGKDSKDLLQGLITNDINLLANEPAIHCALLTPQGKYLFDFFIVSDGDDLLLDCESSRMPDLIRRLMMYRLRAEVEITNISDSHKVYALWDSETGYKDPRDANIGNRLITDTAPSGDALFLEDYEEKRLTIGLADGCRDIAVDKNFILEANFKELNSVSFTKGCYVGQELTARMNHRTTVKKRLLPVISKGGELESGAAITNSDGKSVGDIRSVSGNRAIAFIKLEYLGGDNSFMAGQTQIEAILPDWLDLSA